MSFEVKYGTNPPVLFLLLSLRFIDWFLSNIFPAKTKLDSLYLHLIAIILAMRRSKITFISTTKVFAFFENPFRKNECYFYSNLCCIETSFFKKHRECRIFAKTIAFNMCIAEQKKTRRESPNVTFYSRGEYCQTTATVLCHRSKLYWKAMQHLNKRYECTSQNLLRQRRLQPSISFSIPQLKPPITFEELYFALNIPLVTMRLSIFE